MITELEAVFEKSQYDVPSTPFWQEYENAFIYGAGNVGKDVFSVLTQRGIPVIAFFDRKAKPDEYWKGFPVLQPDSECVSAKMRKHAFVIIAIHNRDVEIPPIIEKLVMLGYGRTVTLIELYDYFGQEMGNRFWLTPRYYYQSVKSFITSVAGLWADEASKALYTALVQFRLTGNYSFLPKPDMEHQYFPSDLPQSKMPLRFVDCGAFDGDTLASLINMGFDIEATASFEPDQENFQKLVHFVEINREALSNTALWPCGVWSSTRQLRFTSGQGESCNVSSAGDIMVQCVSLDDAIPFFAPNFIKMDIEGAEYDAVLGARQTIVKYKPVLAISLYHCPEHLWQIPLLINRLVGGGV